MKRMIFILSMIIFFSVCGCDTNMTAEERQRFGEAFLKGWQADNENRQRQLDRQNDYANAFNAAQARKRNTYWQEQRAKQEYFDRLWSK